MKKKVTIFVLIIFFTFIHRHHTYAQGCENTVVNGSFKTNLSGWANSGSGANNWVWNSSYGALMYFTSGSSDRTLSQNVSNVAVENGYITLYLRVYILRQGYNNNLRILWNGAEVVRFTNSSAAAATTITRAAGVIATHDPGAPMDDALYYITVKIPYNGGGPASGTIGLRAVGGSGQIYVDNIFIPRHGGCTSLSTGVQPTFTCEPNIGYIFQNNPSPGVEGVAKAYRVNLLNGNSTEVNAMLINANATQFSQIQPVGYNVVDNYIWGHRTGTNQLVRIGSDFSVEYLSIPGLPNKNFSSGDIDANGIYYLGYTPPMGGFQGYANTIERIDLNTGTRLAPIVIGTNVDFIDMAINPVDGHMYTVKPGNITRQLVKFNVSTGFTTVVATYNVSQIGTNAFGGMFFDHEGNLFVSANATGNIYRFSTVQAGGTPAVAYIATGPSTNSNDGARCPYTPIAHLISGSVWNDANGDAVKASSGEPSLNLGTTNTNGLWANLVNSLGEVVASVPVNEAGAYTLYTIENGTYSVILTNAERTKGAQLVSADILPAGWEHTGTNVNGVANSGNRSGIISTVTVASADVVGLNFGVQRLPDSDDKAYVMLHQPLAGSFLPLNGSIDNAPLVSGTDPEDGIYAGETGTVRTPRGVVISGLPTNGELWYNGILVELSDVNNGTLYEDPSMFSFKFTGSGYTTTTFQYAYVDAAGAKDPTPAVYRIEIPTPLPVSLIGFTADKKDNTVELIWKTESEQNNTGFMIERSADRIVWQHIGFVPTRADYGNSSATIAYSYIDKLPLKSSNYYRLKQVDIDGVFEYSIIRMVTYNATTGYHIYPNPVKDVLRIEGLSGVNNISIINAVGQTVLTTTAVNIPVKQIDMSAVPAGVYIMQITDLNGSTVSQKVMKQ